MSFHPINSRPRNSYGRNPQRFVLAFGSHGWTVCLVWADHLEDALDECIDWIADNAPGLLRDEQVRGEYNRLIAEGKSEDEAFEESTADMTCGGNYDNYIASWEWRLLAENPDRQTLKDIVAQATGY